MDNRRRAHMQWRGKRQHGGATDEVTQALRVVQARSETIEIVQRRGETVKSRDMSDGELEVEVPREEAKEIIN